MPIAVESYGDSAVMVTVDHDRPATRRAGIVDFRARFLARRPPGVLDVISGLESLLVEYDPLVTGPGHIEYAARLIDDLPPEPRSSGAPAPARFRIPVVFDAETGPDLANVADELGLTTAEVIDTMVSSTFTIALLGAATAPMMDGLAVPKPVRRRAEPRTDVVPGSIMIAGTNAIIQPFPGPTGWRVVGRTPHVIVDITRSRPMSYSTGDVVRFVPITADEALALDGTFLLPEGGDA
ncbi:hypothetical protein GCM10023147_10720 [Tsukamurella soli]|uniref:Carboxyltransferase domain-containing protein n=1 Tax=Tsukamurella soli TaxID=644556 RepID=A0ABP8J8K8_9ACTN